MEISLKPLTPGPYGLSSRGSPNSALLLLNAVLAPEYYSGYVTSDEVLLLPWWTEDSVLVVRVSVYRVWI